MKIWKDNEIQRYKDNITYAYNQYLGSNSSEDWSKFWQSFKIFLKETEYIPSQFFQQYRSSYYLSFKNGESILDILNNLI